MQTKILVSAITLSISLILMAGSVKVNQSKAIPAWKNASQVVDGIPMPPPKKGYRASNPVVDGIPIPPPKKRSHAGNNSNVIADGIPMPLPKKKLAA